MHLSVCARALRPAPAPATLLRATSDGFVHGKASPLDDVGRPRALSLWAACAFGPVATGARARARQATRAGARKAGLGQPGGRASQRAGSAGRRGSGPVVPVEPGAGARGGASANCSIGRVLPSLALRQRDARGNAAARRRLRPRAKEPQFRRIRSAEFANIRECGSARIWRGAPASTRRGGVSSKRRRCGADRGRHRKRACAGVAFPPSSSRPSVRGGRCRRDRAMLARPAAARPRPGLLACDRDYNAPCPESFIKAPTPDYVGPLFNAGGYRPLRTSCSARHVGGGIVCTASLERAAFPVAPAAGERSRFHREEVFWPMRKRIARDLARACGPAGYRSGSPAERQLATLRPASALTRSSSPSSSSSSS